MEKHRAVIVGAGRIGAGFGWHDDAYTHAGAYQALRDRVELVGFIEPDNDRATAAKLKWHLPVYEDVPIGLMAFRPDIVSVCVQPEQQWNVLKLIEGVKALWCEKPYVSPNPEKTLVQVNYLRRADKLHRWMATERPGGVLKVFGKDDIHTRCHFDDLAAWWNAKLEYYPQNAPCHYYYTLGEDTYAFPNGGLEKPGDQMRDMLANLLDHLDKGEPLWSPPRTV